MRTDFVANASHELRTPLATVIGYAETLAEEGPVADELRARFGGTIEAEARRMLRIVEDLMSLSRIEADRYRVPDEQVDLGEIARIAVEQASALAERRGCRIECDIGENVPPIAGDFGQLLQLADNLIGNAIRYGCSEEAPLVSVSVQPSGSRVILDRQRSGRRHRARTSPEADRALLSDRSGAQPRIGRHGARARHRQAHRRAAPRDAGYTIGARDAAHRSAFPCRPPEIFSGLVTKA